MKIANEDKDNCKAACKAATEDKAADVDEMLTTTEKTTMVGVKTCQCKAKAAYEAATATANNNAAANEAAYTKGTEAHGVCSGWYKRSNCVRRWGCSKADSNQIGE